MKLAATLCVTFVVGVSALIAHHNQANYLLQRACMDARGNWESKDGGELGCRFPIQTKDEQATKGLNR